MTYFVNGPTVLELILPGCEREQNFQHIAEQNYHFFHEINNIKGQNYSLQIF